MGGRHHRDMEVMGTCRICGNPVLWYEVHNSYQKVHTSCLESEPFDFHFTWNNFTLDLHSELVEPRRLKKIIKSLPTK